MWLSVAFPAAVVTLVALVALSFGKRLRLPALLALRWALVVGLVTTVLGEVVASLLWPDANQGFLVPLFLWAPAAFTLAGWVAFAVALRRAGRTGETPGAARPSL